MAEVREGNRIPLRPEDFHKTEEESRLALIQLIKKKLDREKKMWKEIADRKGDS